MSNKEFNSLEEPSMIWWCCSLSPVTEQNDSTFRGHFTRCMTIDWVYSFAEIWYVAVGKLVRILEQVKVHNLWWTSTEQHQWRCSLVAINWKQYPTTKVSFHFPQRTHFFPARQHCIKMETTRWKPIQGINFSLCYFPAEAEINQNPCPGTTASVTHFRFNGISKLNVLNSNRSRESFFFA